MLIYIYYAFDNRPAWFRLIWKASDVVRSALSKAPFRLKSAIAEVIAALVYWPLARGAQLFEKLGAGESLAAQRLSRAQLLQHANRRARSLRHAARASDDPGRDQIDDGKRRATDIRFSNAVPFWCAVGYKI